jgi:hypothetical protein
MKRPLLFSVLWYGLHLLLLCSFVALICGFVWEASTRSYLRGFSDAIVPASGTPEQKVDSILAWMAQGPARRTGDDPDLFAVRNPEDTLNYQQLLQVCGSATNAFVNLATASGLNVRRLLLLNPDRQAKHVVAEVWLGGRWVVADPSFRSLLRDAQGRLLAKEQLRDPAIFRQATQAIPGYPPAYSYEDVARVRLERLPLIGVALRRILEWISPSWEDKIDWTLLLERESFAFLVVASVLLLVSIVLYFFLSWYGDRRLGVSRIRLRDRLHHARIALLNTNISP